MKKLLTLLLLANAAINGADVRRVDSRALISAIRSDDVAAVIRALEAGANVNTRDFLMLSKENLLDAITRGDLPKAERLLKETGMTLSKMVLTDKDLARALLTGVKSALMEAVVMGNPEIVAQLLLNDKLRINETDGDATALIIAAHRAAKTGSTKQKLIYKMLLDDPRTEVDLKNSLGLTAKDYAEAGPYREAPREVDKEMDLVEPKLKPEAVQAKMSHSPAPEVMYPEKRGCKLICVNGL